MKRLLALFATLALCLLPFAFCLAQDAVNAAAAVQATTAPAFDLVAWLVQLAVANPKLGALFLAMGALRTLFKLLFTFVHRGDATETDHRIAAWLDSSPLAKAIAYALDLVASVKVAHPQADGSLALSSPSGPPLPRTFSFLPFALCLLPLLAVGCTTALNNGYVVSQTTRGLGVKFSAISQSGTPGEMFVGYFSTTSELVPTAKGTNGSGAQIATPNYGASFSYKKTSLLNEDIDETRSFGQTTVLDSGTTNSAPIIQPK